MLNTIAALLYITALHANPTGCETEKTTTAAELKWYTNFNDAQDASLTSNKPIFAFFTGSDWCGWCHKLQREVFSKPAFVTWANEHVILLELDFPRRKELPEELQQQNQSLQQAFQVRGYPTIWIFRAALNDSTGKMDLKALGSLGYPSGATPGQEEVLFIQNADAVLANDGGK